MNKIKLLLVLFVLVSFGCLAFIIAGLYTYFWLGLPLGELLTGLLLFGSGLFIGIIMCVMYWEAIKNKYSVGYKNFAKTHKIPISIVGFIFGISMFLVGYVLMENTEGKILSYAGGAFFCYGALNLAFGNKKDK